MMKGLLLTERDAALLLDCYRHGVLSFVQINRRHFPAAQPPTVCNRLSKLRRARLLAKQRVGIVVYQGTPEEVGTVYQITRRGIAMLRQRYPETTFRDDPLRLNTLTLSHDLRLTDALNALQKRFRGREFVIGKHHCAGKGQQTRVPDAVLLDAEGRAECAIELELTVKSERRYRDILLQYQCSTDYPNVLYVVGSEVIAEKVRFHVTGQKPIPGLPPKTTAKFYFVRLDQLLSRSESVPITNGESSLAA